METKETKQKPKVNNTKRLHPLMRAAVSIVAFAAALFTAGFIVPPLGVIDPSVLKAGGELLGMQSALIFAYCVVSGKTATVKHGDTTATVGGGKNTVNDENAHDTIG